VWRHPVRRRLYDAGRDLPAQSGDTNHEELVEVRAEDGQESDALEQRRAIVERFVEHARIEREPGQLAVDERLRAHRSLMARSTASG
jgi:hypothetical protein